MKLIHTADWHIGKQLYRQDLYEDQLKFFDWLVSCITTNGVDVLLVSGDIFDLANPSNRDLALYYDVLRRLTQTGTKVILTGGNHDSVTMLNAPKDLLNALNITVVGGVPENEYDQIIPIYAGNGSPECIVLAVPFLRDKDLRMSVEANVAEEKSAVIRNAIKQHYQKLVERTYSEYGDKIPVIAMGHLFMSGALTSDSEREIHIGNLEGIPAGDMPDGVDYWALGHIHKPQKVAGKSGIRYSGSPLFLDFSEVGHEKCVIELNVEKGKNITINTVPVPELRKLIRLKGCYNDVLMKLEKIKNDESGIPVWLEIEIIETQINPDLLNLLDSLPEKFESENIKIIKSRITVETSEYKATQEIFTGRQIEDLSPVDIFNKKMDETGADESTRKMLLEAYREVLTEIQQESA